ncbi:hypothetical protein DPEC_G00324160 [Dallia pectoralis]|uniref:Uncharacterized protein n=1 Tax=Dallia pectoralis TaxID=75939 RepID=A0ACC2FAV9_DALPE|nr:hypothetical protein DPEC_G00324160 [Dallia pectoralis]
MEDRPSVTETEMALGTTQQENCNIQKQLSDWKRLFGECETRAEIQLAELQSARQECQDLKMRLKNSQEKNNVLNLQLTDQQTKERTIEKLSEGLKNIEAQYQCQKRQTGEAQDALAIEKQATKFLHQKIFKLSCSGVSLNKPCKTPNTTWNAFKAPPSQDLRGKPTKTKTGSPNQIQVLAPEPGSQHTFRPVGNENGRQRNCCPFRKFFRMGKFSRKC